MACIRCFHTASSWGALTALGTRTNQTLSASDATGAVLCSVWYIDKDSNRQPAVVVAVDVTHPPPSYCIRLDGADRTRDTEEGRLELRAAQTLPKPAQGDSPCIG